MEGLHPGDKYVELITVRLVGMMLTIAIKESLRLSISKCSSAMVGTGTLKFGNKGGVGVSLQLNETLLCFVNSHLAAHLAEVERRNEDHDEILRRMQFSDGFKSRSIEEHHQIYWFGVNISAKKSNTKLELIMSFVLGSQLSNPTNGK